MKESIITNAVKKGQKSLSEFDSKRVLHKAGVPITKEKLAKTKAEAVKIAKELGYPVALKGCGDKATHKTEMGLVKLKLMNEKDVKSAYDEIMKKGYELDGVLVQEMIAGDREFVIGMTRDPQFGPCVMFGLGGIYTEVLKDVSFRIAPITEFDAEEMMDEIKSKKLLGEFRGSPAVNKKALVKALIGVAKLGVENEEIAEIDINPLIIAKGKPIAVDGLVVLKS